MNILKVLKTLGKILIVESFFMFLSFIVGLCYKEFEQSLSLAISFLTVLAVGLLLTFAIRTKKTKYLAKEGFLCVGLSWLIMSLFATMPYMLTGSIPNFFNAFLECCSGFTTTGASIIPNVEDISHGVLIWRELTHWVGGMGILVFMFAFAPIKDSGSIFVFGAETTGFRADKLVSKLRSNARILYLIYIGLTVLETILLVFKMPFFDALLHSMGTVSTGGFSTRASSIQSFNSLYVEMVIVSFMFLSSLNFTLFFLLLMGNFKDVFKNEELRWYLCFLVTAILIISVSLLETYGNFGTALRYASFQALTCSSTTGYFSTNFTDWPVLTKSILLILMLGGGMIGSTAGGIKTARVAITFKSTTADISTIFHPNRVRNVKFGGKLLTVKDTRSVRTFIVVYFIFLIFSTFLLSVLGPTSFETNLTGTISALSNVGPFFGTEAAYSGNFLCFNWAQKLLLSIEMLAGRLEIFPILILFMPHHWRYK